MEVDEIQNQVCKFPRKKQCPDDEHAELNRTGTGNSFGRVCNWPSSRIVRVSRASGGKDRHSKVWTSKGLRDRRVRLSVPTAIQFYDLQDRLGYDQPSKAVEWLLKAAAGSISELPSINTSFPTADETPNQTENQTEDVEHVSLSKSGCSSNSETSKGSAGLSLSHRCESRIKARERARERTAEREKENNNHHPISQSSFTELLTCGTNNYFSSQFNPDMQNFSFVSDGGGGVGGANDYNLNFTISSSTCTTTSGLAGYNRGTLQSNSPSHQRFSLMDGSSSSSNAPFFAPPNAAVVVSAPSENHHHHHHQFPPGLQLYYGGQHSDQKGKGKN